MIFLRPYHDRDFSIVFETENALFHPMTESEFESLYIQDKLIEIMMIDSGEQSLGYVIVWQDIDKAQIYSMVIFEPYRNQGFGYDAMMLLEMQLKEKGIHDWTLEVRQSNKKAISLYEKVGFKIVATRKNYYQNHEDALLMLKII